MKIPVLVDGHKHVFASYSAMALMNVQTVFNHIQKVVGIEGELENENYWAHPILQYLWNDNTGSDNNPEKLQAIMEMLLRNVPSLKIMAENRRESENKRNGTRRLEINSRDICSSLDKCLRVLKRYRDYASHLHIKDDCWDDGSQFLTNQEQILAIIINSYYGIALRNVKERYKYDTSQLAFIQDYRFKKEMVPGKGHRMVTDYDFFLSMQNKNGDKTGRAHLSGVGVVLLICLFLEKKYINTFLSKIHIHGRYSNNSEEYRIIRRSMSINSIVLPKDRISCEKKGMSVAMDMLNELKRCPKELFDTLSWEDQDRFRIISSDYNEVLQMRSSDRFAQLSLQYIDSNRLFEKIRFHVNMGKLRYLFNADKLCIDNQVRVRVIEHLLNGYGRIDEMEQYRKNANGAFGDTNVEIRDFENVKRDDANTKNYPYVTDVATRYMLDNNKVEFCFSNDKIVPDVCYEDGSDKWYVEKQVPDCRMSVLEIPAMMFHMHLLGNEKTERRIAEVYDSYKKLFHSLSEGTLTKENIDGFGIKRADMPKKLLEAIDGSGEPKIFNVAVLEEIKELLDETKMLLERHKRAKKDVISSENKMGKRGFVQLSSGKVADFLARDIVKFQPSLLSGSDYGTDRITGLNYRVMQATIATYGNGDSYDDFYNMFVKAHLVGGRRERNHPFLYNALRRRPQNALELYENYLYSREQYLKQLLNILKDGENVNVPFVNKDRNKWKKRSANYYKIMGEIYGEDLAIELPRQMFDDEIKQALKKIPAMAGVGYEQANVTYLIGEYLKRVLHDGSQKFYSWKRNYRYIDMLQCQTDRKNSLVKSYTTTTEREKIWENRTDCVVKYNKWALNKKQNDRTMSRVSDADFEELLSKRVSKCRNEFQKDEKTIRRYKVQDALMFIMVQDILKRHIEFKAEDFRLEEIMPDADRGILSKIMPMEFKFERGSKQYTIYTDGMKLKNYGDFFTLAHDKRLVSLLDILNTRRVDKDAIEKELDNYDTCRPRMARLILDFEKMAFDKYPEMIDLVKDQSRFGFTALLDELISRRGIDNRHTETLRIIRNAFSHNIYPSRGVIQIRTLPEIANHLIEIFREYAQIDE